MDRRTAALLFPLAFAVLVLSGCELEPDVGAPLHARCSDEDSDPDRDISFRVDILDGLFARTTAGCHECHDPSASPPLGFDLGGLDLTSYTGLSAGGVNSAADIVVAGEPCRSVLYRKLGPGPPFGARMPASGPPFLTDAELELVHDWIAEGARDN